MVSGRCLAGLVLLACVTGLVSGQGGIWPPDQASAVNHRWTIPDAQRVLEKILSEKVDSYVVHTNLQVISSASTMTDDNTYVVGGFVRDNLRNVESKDIDVGYRRIGARASRWDTDAVVSLVRAKLTSSEARYVYNSGIICKVGAGLDGQASYVTPLELVDGSISVGSTNAFRDFSVNAVYYDVHAKNFYDPTGYGVMDTMTNTLRVACFSDRDCASTWFTGLSGGTEYRKVQRYWHMRMKGYEPEPTTRKLIYDVMTTTGSMRDTVMSDLALGLDKQTMNYQLCEDEEVCTYKMARFIESFAEDVAAVEGAKVTHKFVTSIARNRMGHIWVAVKKTTVSGRYYLRARTSTFRGALKVRLGDSSTVTLEANRNAVEGKALPAEVVVSCSSDCDTIIISGLTTLQSSALDLLATVKHGHKSVPPSLLIPSTTQSQQMCNKAVDISLYQVALYDGLTVRRLREINDGSRDTWADFVKFRSNMKYLEEVAMPKTMTYPGVEYITKKFLLDYARILTSNSRISVDMARAGIDWVGIPGKFDVTPDSFVEAVNNGNSREHFFLMWNLVTRTPSAWIGTGKPFDTSSNAGDACEGTTPLPMPPGWVHINYSCGVSSSDTYKASYCKSPRVSNSGSNIRFRARDTFNPPLSERERSGAVSGSYMNWNLGCNIYEVSDDMLPNPLAGEHAVQGGFKHQALSNGFSVLAGASGSGLYIMEFARRYLNWGPEDLALLRLGLMASMPTTKGHSMYEAMMAAEPYMSDEVRLLDLPAAEYVNFGAQGLLPKTIRTVALGELTYSGSRHTYVAARRAAPSATYGQAHYTKWLATNGARAPALTAAAVEPLTIGSERFDTYEDAVAYVEAQMNLKPSTESPRKLVIQSEFYNRHVNRGIYMYRASLNMHAMVAQLAATEDNVGRQVPEYDAVLAAMKDVLKTTYKMVVDDSTGLPAMRKPRDAAAALTSVSVFKRRIQALTAAMDKALLESCAGFLRDRTEGYGGICQYLSIDYSKNAYQYALSALAEAETLMANIKAETFSNRMSGRCMMCQLAVGNFQAHGFARADTIVDTADAADKYCSTSNPEGYTVAMYGRFDSFAGMFATRPYPIPSMSAYTYSARPDQAASMGADSYESVCPEIAGRILSMSSRAKDRLVDEVTGAPMEGDKAVLWATKPREICESEGFCSSSDVQTASIRHD